MLLLYVLVWCCLDLVASQDSRLKGVVNLRQPIDDFQALDDLARNLPSVSREHIYSRGIALDREDGERIARKRESYDADRKRRDMEFDLRRDRDRNERRDGSPRKSTSNLKGINTSVRRPSYSSDELERQRETDRKQEIAREIAKAQQNKERELSRDGNSLKRDSSEGGSFHKRRSGRDETERDTRERRNRDRALRTDRRHRDHGHGHRTSSESVEKDRHRHHHHHHRPSHKKPILIFEKVTPSYHETSSEEHHSHRRPPWGGSSSSSSSSPRRPKGWRDSTLQDPRRPDRPVILPRPDVSHMDRRPGRPSYPSKYDGVRYGDRHPPKGHSHEVVLHHSPSPDEKLFPVAGVLPHAPPPPPPPPVLVDNTLAAAAHAEAAIKHQLGQAIIAGQALQAHQAIRAQKIKQATVAAQLAAGQVAAAQQVAVHQAAAAQQAVAHQAVAQQAVAGNVAAGLQAAQLGQVAAAGNAAAGLQAAQLGQVAAAGNAAAGLQAAQLGHVAAGNAAVGLKAAQLGQVALGTSVAGHQSVKAAIKNKLKYALKHRLKTRLQQGVVGAVSHHGTNLHHHIGEIRHHLQRARVELFRRLLLLKPYFQQGITKGYAVPTYVPDLPVGVNLTPLQVDTLPKVPIKVPKVVSPPSSIHIPDLKEVVKPPLDVEYVEYILSLPDDAFNTITNMSKREFMLVLFPRLYRGSVRHLTPLTTTPVVYKKPSSSSYTSLATPSGHYPSKTPSHMYQTPKPVHYPPQTFTPVYQPPKTPAPMYQTPKAPPPLYKLPTSTTSYTYGPPPTPHPPITPAHPITHTPKVIISTPPPVRVSTIYVPTTRPFVPSTTPHAPTTKPFVPIHVPHAPTIKPIITISSPHTPTAKPFVPVTIPHVPTKKPFIPITTPHVPITPHYVPPSTPYVPTVPQHVIFTKPHVVTTTFKPPIAHPTPTFVHVAPLPLQPHGSSHPHPPHVHKEAPSHTYGPPKPSTVVKLHYDHHDCDDHHDDRHQDESHERHGLRDDEVDDQRHHVSTFQKDQHVTHAPPHVTVQKPSVFHEAPLSPGLTTPNKPFSVVSNVNTTPLPAASSYSTLGTTPFPAVSSYSTLGTPVQNAASHFGTFHVTNKERFVPSKIHAGNVRVSSLPQHGGISVSPNSLTGLKTIHSTTPAPHDGPRVIHIKTHHESKPTHFSIPDNKPTHFTTSAPGHSKATHFPTSAPGHSKATHFSTLAPGHIKATHFSASAPGHSKGTHFPTSAPGHSKGTHFSTFAPGHSKATHFSTFAPGHSKATHFTTSAPGHSKATHFSASAPGHSKGTHFSTLAPVHSKATHFTTSAPGHSKSTHFSAPGHSKGTHFSTLAPVHSKATHFTTSAPGHNKATHFSAPGHSKGTHFSTFAPGHSKATHFTTSAPGHSKATPFSTIAPVHSKATPFSSFVPSQPIHFASTPRKPKHFIEPKLGHKSAESIFKIEPTLEHGPTHFSVTQDTHHGHGVSYVKPHDTHDVSHEKPHVPHDTYAALPYDTHGASHGVPHLTHDVSHEKPHHTHDVSHEKPHIPHDTYAVLPYDTHGVSHLAPHDTHDVSHEKPHSPHDTHDVSHERPHSPHDTYAVLPYDTQGAPAHSSHEGSGTIHVVTHGPPHHVTTQRPHHSGHPGPITSDPHTFHVQTSDAPQRVTPTVVGVGLRPHGGQHQFLTPVSPVAPFFPSSSTTPSFTSTYASSVPSVSYAPPVSHTPSVPTTTYSPPVPTTTTHFAVIPTVTSTTHSPPTTTFSPNIPSTTYFPPIPTTTFFPTTYSPPEVTTTTSSFEPATTPVFVVTEIPESSESSTVFRLTPEFVNNGQLLPGVAIRDDILPFQSVDEPFRTYPEDSEEILLEDSLEIPLDKITSVQIDGSHLDRVPGTDSNDDEHILSPFTKRKGNATLHGGFGGQHHQSWPLGVPLNQTVTPLEKPSNPAPGPDDILYPLLSQDDPFGVYSDYLDQILSPESPPPSVSSASASHEGHISPSNTSSSPAQVRPPVSAGTQLPQFPGQPHSPSLLPLDTLGDRQPPKPQLVGVDGLPVPGLPEGLHRPNRTPGVPPRPVTAEDLAKLPPYLREAPVCATIPTNRSFCIMPQGYPGDLASSLVNKYRKELDQTRSVLDQLPPPSIDLSQARNQLPNIDPSVSCETEKRNVQLSWSRDVLGNWFVIMQTPPFAQSLTVTTCSAAARARGCRPLLQPRPLIALQPKDPEPRPFVFDFPLPVACVFAAAADPSHRASSSPVTAVLKSDDLPVTSPPPDLPYSPDVTRQTHDFLTSQSESAPRLTVTSPFSEPFSLLTSPSSQPIPDDLVTSHAFPHFPLPWSPDALPGEEVHDFGGVPGRRREAEDQVTQGSGCIAPCLTHVLLTLTLTLLVQR